MREHHNARYSFLFVPTTEEERIMRENRARFDEDVQFFSWDIAAGYQAMVRNGGGAWTWRPIEVPGFVPKGGNGRITDPGMALESATALPENSVVFMKDYHKYFEKITIIRAALNLKPILKLQAKTIVFLAAQKVIPPELSNDITVVDYPYPDDKALMRILEKMAEDNEMEVPENAETIVNAMRGLTWEGAENALALSLVMKGTFDVKTILDQKGSQLKASGVLEFGTYTETLDDLFGLEILKRYIRTTIGNPKARGVLMYGVPGTGKSHTAKATANEFGLPCFVLNFSEIKDKYVGASESKLREAFKTIHAVGKCVVFMDEIEAIATGISSGGDSGVGQTLYKQLLREMEDAKGQGIYWMATCNDLAPLIHESGGAIMRRFGGKFFCDMPTEPEARGIARIWSEKERVDIPETFPLDGYTGADIASLAENMAMFECAAEEASQYVLPYGIAHSDELEEIRRKAAGVCIPAGVKQEKLTLVQGSRKVRRGKS